MKQEQNDWHFWALEVVKKFGGWYLGGIPVSMLKRFIPFVFILLWIVPVGWVGLMRSNYPLYPSWLAPLFRVSGVFESAPTRWRIFFIEFQDKERGNWHDINESALFAPTPLGGRTRFQQLMNEIANSKSSHDTPKLLDWISVHLPQAGIFRSQVKAIRIVNFGIAPETFLKCRSLPDLHKMVTAMNVPCVIVDSLNLPFPVHEKP